MYVYKYYICICIYIYTYIHTYIHTYIQMYTNVYKCMNHLFSKQQLVQSIIRQAYDSCAFEKMTLWCKWALYHVSFQLHGSKQSDLFCVNWSTSGSIDLLQRDPFQWFKFKHPLESLKLVGGWGKTPLKKIRVRQLGWLFPGHHRENAKHGNQTTNQEISIHIHSFSSADSLTINRGLGLMSLLLGICLTSAKQISVGDEISPRVGWCETLGHLPSPDQGLVVLMTISTTPGQVLQPKVPFCGQFWGRGMEEDVLRTKGEKECCIVPMKIAWFTRFSLFWLAKRSFWLISLHVLDV